MDKKIIIALFLGIIMFTGCGTKNVKLKDNGVVEQKVKVDKLSFDNISLQYENGITTLTADIVENQKITGDTLVTIYLKDNDGKEIKKVQQIIEKTSDMQILQVGIVGDYSYVKNVEFKTEDS